MTERNDYEFSDEPVDDAHMEESLGSASRLGLQFVPALDERGTERPMPNGTGDFAKWIHQEHPDIIVHKSNQTRRLVQRSEDIWLPLVLLGPDIVRDVYLGLVADYVRDRLGQYLRPQDPTIEFSFVYKDKKKGKSKKVYFKGPLSALEKVVRKD